MTAPATLYDLLEDSARNWPSRVAVGTAGSVVKLTYEELDQLVTSLADQLVRLGVGHSDTIAIFSDNCIEYVLALFAVVSVGAVATPLDPNLAPQEVRSRLSVLGARATIIPEHLYAKFIDANSDAAATAWKLVFEPRHDPEIQATIFAPHGAPTCPVAQPRHRPAGGDVAVLMLTAGTTSAAKIVPLTHANLTASIKAILDTYRLLPDDATLLVMPLFHGHGLIAGLLATLVSGGAAYVPRGGRFHASTFWADLMSAAATWYTAVPTIHQILLSRAGSDYPKEYSPRLRFMRSCSAPLAPTVQRDLETAFGAPVVQAYGMTEAAHQVASNPLPSDGANKPDSVGLPTGVTFRVARQDGTAAPTGTIGEIWVRGASVTSGYLDNPQANAASFTGDWFQTGDLGYQDAEGYVFLNGRIKEIINRGGDKISLAEVDAVLESNPKVQDAMSFGVPDKIYGEEIEAAVILRPGQVASEDEMINYCRTELRANETPKHFHFVTEFPRTEKGTGDRRQLAAEFGPQQ